MAVPGSNPKGGRPKLKVARGGEALTEMQEAFCQHYCTTKNGTQSYLKSGFRGKAAATNASKLLKQPKIQARLRELGNVDTVIKEENAFESVAQKAIAKMAVSEVASQDWVIEQLVINAMQARRHKSFGASNSALVKIGEHVGMWKDMRKGDTDGRTEEQLAAELHRIIAVATRESTEADVAGTGEPVCLEPESPTEDGSLEDIQEATRQGKPGLAALATN